MTDQKRWAKLAIQMAHDLRAQTLREKGSLVTRQCGWCGHTDLHDCGERERLVKSGQVAKES